MQILKFKKFGFIVAIGLFLFAACNDNNQLSNPKTYKPLSKDERLDSILQASASLDFTMMIDSKVVTGQNGWNSADTIIFGANDPDRNGPYRTYVSRMIGDFEPFSKEKNKYALYTPVERFITIKAADSVSKFGVNSGDTALVLFLHQYQRVSHALPELDNTALDDFISAFPHKGPIA